MKKNNLLIEILTEELPPASQQQLGEHFGKYIAQKLHDFNLIEAVKLESFSTPRRLAVKIDGVVTQAESSLKLIKLMPKKIGYDANGELSQPLLKKLNALGEDESSVPHLKIKFENNQEIIYLEKNFQGHQLNLVIEEIIEDSIKALPIAKTMSYQLADGWTTVNFVRPAKNILALHGDQPINFNTLGLKSKNTTLGHRFESSSEIVKIAHADQYEEQMFKEGKVIVNFNQRKNKIWESIQKKVSDLASNYHVNEDENLLNEVTALVEMPNVLIGKFDEKFLNIPHECLELTMKSNQKYFPVVDANNKITNYFVIVANLSPKNVASIIQGNEKVIRPRLSDAEFFFKKDKEESLSKLAKKLAQVTYHNKLGTQHDRALRVAKIHSYIDKTLQFNNAFDFKKLALASKADLSSLMVGEFPELQGIMGSYYAENDGEEKIFCEAIEDHYSPKFSGDKLPRNNLGLGLALADKIETLISLFSINEIPTGDKDPFALRRASIGILRILIEKNLALNVIHTIKHFYPNNKNLDELILFIKERLINFLREKKYTPQEVDAVTSNLSNEFNTLLDKLEALQSFVKLDEAAHLAASNKRVANIIKKYQFDNDVKVNKLHLIENEEKILYELLIELDLEVKRDAENKSYIDALSKLVQLKQPIDAFFDKVMVNADDIKLKRNRHNLMLLLHQTFNRVADISKLTT